MDKINGWGALVLIAGMTFLYKSGELAVKVLTHEPASKKTKARGEKDPEAK